MAGPRIRIQGKTYKVPALSDLSMDDILVLDLELQERYGSSWVKVQRFSQEMQALKESGLPDEETELIAQEHPMATLMEGVTVWMVLRVAGKTEITMQEALKIPSDAVEEVWMDAPKDRLPKKRQPRKASAPATDPGPSVSLA